MKGVAGHSLRLVRWKASIKSWQGIWYLYQSKNWWIVIGLITRDAMGVSWNTLLSSSSKTEALIPKRITLTMLVTAHVIPTGYITIYKLKSMFPTYILGFWICVVDSVWMLRKTPELWPLMDMKMSQKTTRVPWRRPLQASLLVSPLKLEAGHFSFISR